MGAKTMSMGGNAHASRVWKGMSTYSLAQGSFVLCRLVISQGRSVFYGRSVCIKAYLQTGVFCGIGVFVSWGKYTHI